MAMGSKGSKTIRVSSKIVKFLQDKMIPLTGTSASQVLERELGITREGEADFQYFWLIKSKQHGQIIAVDNPHKALQFAKGIQGVQIIPVREVRT